MGAAARGWRLAAVVAGAVVALDQITKQLVVTSLEPREERNVFFAIDLTYVRNKGVAFGALGDGGVVVTALTVAALAILAAYFAMNAARPHLWLPVGMVAGGALGNLADRAREGSVIDFIDPMLWPAFNLADAAIVLGILGLLYVIEDARG
jgi:signal peptidase II